MLQTLHNSSTYLGMDLFKEIEDFNNLFCVEKSNEINCGNGFEDFQNKCTNLHENYSKEVDNTKKVGKSLAKCLKFYSKLCKKYEVQQKLISSLELTIQEKNCIIEESQKSIDKMAGLIRVYENERTSFKGPACDELKRDKELLLDVCCKLIGEADRSSYTTRNLGKLILKKFRKDLTDERINVIKQKVIKNEEKWPVKPPDLLDFNQTKMEFKFEEKYSKELKDIKDELPKESEKISPEFDIVKGEIKDKNIENVSLDLKVAKEEEPVKEIENGPLDLRVSEEEEPIKEAENVSKMDVAGHKELLRRPPNISQERKIVEQETPLEGGCTLCINELPSLPVLENSERDANSNSPTIPVVTPSLNNAAKQSVCFDLTPSESLFDINVSNNLVSRETVSIDAEISFGASVKEDSPFFEDELLLLEEEVNRITIQLALPRLLSPIPVIDEQNEVAMDSENSKGCELTVGKKRVLDEKEISRKKLKPCGPLDSIMSAMSLQNEVFKAKGCHTYDSSFRCTRSFTRANRMRKSDENEGSLKENSFVQKNRQQAEEKVVRKGLSDFVVSPITSKEDADKNVQRCVGILKNKSEELIARAMVSIVLENIDEPVEIFERPAPPLTKTQHRLIVLLSVFQKVDDKAENIPPLILSMISKKLFPDNFFWPDDSVEAATRFYAALCRSRNDTKNLWKFCIQAMSNMRQRCPMVVFAVLQTWPDVLHDSSTLKNNILALTIVNLFLHMPKSEGLRNLNQKRKLMALRHLLMNFYQFQIVDTIENFTKKVLEMVMKDEAGAEKSLVMLAKCRDADWVVKNVVPTLKNAVLEWGQGGVDDGTAQRILSVIKQISLVLTEAKDWKGAKIKELVASLCGILISGSKNHELELQVIEVLLQLKQHEEARKAISEWIPKKPINKNLQNEIINMSADNVLKEWKRNRERDSKTSLTKGKPKKKTKGQKKRRGKKRKNPCANSNNNTVSGISS